MGEGNSHRKMQKWEYFENYRASLSHKKYSWLDDLASKNLGTLGGGNHFIELQRSTEDKLWMMIHSGSRNLGYKIANYYHKKALAINIADPPPSLQRSGLSLCKFKNRTGLYTGYGICARICI